MMAIRSSCSIACYSNNGVAKRLPKSVVAAIHESGIIGIRAGRKSDHRFIGVWPVVVGGRVFARSWKVSRGGWFETFQQDPLGTLQIGERQLRVRAVRIKSERIRDAVEDAYAEKYHTPASMKYVRGFRTARRRDTTTEFVPR